MFTFLVNSNSRNIQGGSITFLRVQTDNLSSHSSIFTSTEHRASVGLPPAPSVVRLPPDLQIKCFIIGMGEGCSDCSTAKRLSFQSPGTIYSHRHKTASVFKEVVNRTGCISVWNDSAVFPVINRGNNWPNKTSLFILLKTKNVVEAS